MPTIELDPKVIIPAVVLSLLSALLADTVKVALQKLWTAVIKRSVRWGSTRFAAWAQRAIDKKHERDALLMVAPTLAVAHVGHEVTKFTLSVVALPLAFLGMLVAVAGAKQSTSQWYQFWQYLFMFISIRAGVAAIYSYAEVKEFRDRCLKEAKERSAAGQALGPPERGK